MDPNATHHDPNTLSDDADRLTQLDPHALTSAPEESNRPTDAGAYLLGSTDITGSIIDIACEFLPFDF